MPLPGGKYMLLGFGNLVGTPVIGA